MVNKSFTNVTKCSYIPRVHIKTILESMVVIALGCTDAINYITDIASVYFRSILYKFSLALNIIFLC